MGKILTFYRRFGVRQTLCKVLDDLFPLKRIVPQKLPVPAADELPAFSFDRQLCPDGVDYPEDLCRDDAPWLIIAPDGKAVLKKTALRQIAAFLKQNPDCELIYFDSEVSGSSGGGYFCRPDFSPEYLRSYDYIGELCAIRRELAEKITPGSITEIFLSAAESGVNIAHFPQIIYSVSGVSQTAEGGCEAVSRHLIRCGIAFDEVIPCGGGRRIKYQISGEPLISILIPSHNQPGVLKRCVESLLNRSDYRNFEIVIVENGSNAPELFDYYRELENSCDRVKVVSYPVKESFNYSRINNFGAEYCAGEYILFLNNDTELISPESLREMLMFARMPDVGVTGAKLLYMDGTVQHCGSIIGMGGIAAHHSLRAGREEGGYLNTLQSAREFSAVTFACAMVRRSDFFSTGKLDEDLAVAYNDIDFCLRMRNAGKRVICTPHSLWFHHESLSRGLEDSPEKIERIAREAAIFEARHAGILQNGDPFYNPNLNLSGKSFTPRGRLGRLKLIQRRKRS